ncbi:MAG: DUF1543 domain-containing protein [Bdellovibrionia bacterium]
MKLYLVHCGYYDSEICEGLYEGHANFFVAAESAQDACLKVKLISEFKAKHMHVDGLQELVSVDGYEVELKWGKSSQKGKSIVINHRQRELAPKKNNL